MNRLRPRTDTATPNPVVAVGGAVSIADSTATAGGRTVAAALMVLIASLCALLPLGVYSPAVRGRRGCSATGRRGRPGATARS